jgi:hypothetical protein
MTEPALGTTTIMQIGIVVRDIRATAKAWSETLGLPMPNVIITQRVDQAQTEYEGERTPARAKLAFFDMGQVQVELIEPVDGPSTWRDQLDRHGPSLHHIAFQIEGMGEKVAYLGEHGVPLVQKGEFPGGRYAYLDGTSPLGTIIELLESD